MPHISEEELALLRGLFLFTGVPEAVVRAAVGDEGCRVEEIEKGETIFTPHDYRRALGVILSGKVRVTKAGYEVSVLQRGELFGAAALFNEEKDYATTLTAKAACRVIFFSQRLMQRTMAEYPVAAGNYIRYLSGRIRFLEGKLDGLLAPGADGKLGQYLLAHSVDGTVVLDCPISSLAGRLDVSRASLYRAFEALEKSGAIERDGKTVRILKEELLK